MCGIEDWLPRERANSAGWRTTAEAETQVKAFLFGSIY